MSILLFAHEKGKIIGFKLLYEHFFYYSISILFYILFSFVHIYGCYIATLIPMSSFKNLSNPALRLCFHLYFRLNLKIMKTVLHKRRFSLEIGLVD